MGKAKRSRVRDRYTEAHVDRQSGGSREVEGETETQKQRSKGAQTLRGRDRNVETERQRGIGTEW